MKKILFVMLIILFAGISATVARDIEDFYKIEITSKTPDISREYPGQSMNSLVISASDEMIQFFLARGIESQYLSEDCNSIPDDVFLQMKSICANCESEFCSALNNTVARLMETHYDAIVVRIADVYWTVLT